MALRALTRINRGRRGKPLPFAAPVGGLNRRDALAAMAANDAYAMDNWFPATDAVETRLGSLTQNILDAGQQVETLITYQGDTQKLLAFSNGKIRDVSGADVGEVDGAGLAADENFIAGSWSHTAAFNDGFGNANGAGGAAGFLFQTSGGILNGRTYRYFLTITTRSAGSVQAYVGSAGTAVSASYNAAGTYTGTIVANSNSEMGVKTTDTFTGKIGHLQFVEVLTPATVAPTLGTYFTNNIIQSTMFTNAATHWLILCNGTDQPQGFDGTNFTALNITGVTGSYTALKDVFSFKGRLYFVANNQAGFYYLGLGNIQGAASYFDLGQVSSKGGNLRTITSITKDSGDGPDDYIVFIMETGEYIVYAGNDPSNANNWSLVGRFYIAPPVGLKPIIKYGGDALVITQSGLISLTSVFDGQVFNPDQDALSAKLGNLISTLIPNAGNTHGWQCLLHPTLDMLVLNVPVGPTRGTYYQYVMNTRTGAWCRFVSLDGQCWALFNNSLYFGRYDGKVIKALTGFTDDGVPIRSNVKQAYSYFDEPGVKKWDLVKLTLSSTGAPAISVGMGVDFKDDEPNYAISSLVGQDSLWDIATWDVDPWGADEGVNYFTQDIDKLGFAGSVNVKVEVNGDQVRWYATQHVFELGGLIGDTR